MGRYILLASLVFILSLIIGTLLGNVYTNYEVGKCKYIVPDNQYYEAQQDCYITLQRPEWNRFWNCFIISLIITINLEFVIVIVYIMKEF